MSEIFSVPPWQAPLWRFVGEGIRQQRLGHALLLSGPAGNGKAAFATAIAAALWCRTPAADGQGCGHCADCRQVLSEAHSGYHRLRVEEDKRDIAIEAVRDLIEKLQVTSHDGRAKVAIVEPADALNTSGVNALLKTIEEPSPGSYLILISDRPQALPATLRSRCQRLRFAPPPEAVALAWLRAAGGEADEPTLQAALTAAYGAPQRALALLKAELPTQHRQWAAAMLELAAGRGEPLAFAAAVGDANAVAFVHWLFGWLLGLLRARTGAELEPAVQALAARLPPQWLDRYVGEVQEALHRVFTNASKPLLLESLLIGWVALLARAGRSTQNAA